MSTQTTVTDDNVGPAVNVVTWLLGATTLLAVVARLATKRILSGIAIDDYIIIAALISCLGMSVTTGFATANGLGQHIYNLTDSQVRIFEKALYAGQVLYVMVLALSKISILYFLRSLTPIAFHQTIITFLSLFISTWGLSGLLTVAFQCRVPQTWQVLARDQCIQQLPFWNYFNIVNIALETALIMLPAAIVWSLQLKTKRRLLIISCFVVRVAIIAAAVPELVYLNRAFKSGDFTFDLWPEALCLQVLQSLSIITACIPYLKPFFEGLQTGMIRTDDLRRRAGGKTSGYFSGSSHGRSGTPGSRTLELNMMDRIGGKRSRATTGLEKQDDAQSQASHSEMIRQTITWEVHSELHEP